MPSYSSNTDPRPISDQYLLGKCKAVPLQDFLFANWMLSIIVNWQIRGVGAGIAGTSQWGVCCLALQILNSLSIRRFWRKGERCKRKRERAEGDKRLTQMLLLEPSTPTQHDSIPSNQNHFRSLSYLHVSNSSPKITLTLWSGRAPVLVLLRFRFFLKPPVRSFQILTL